MIQVNTICTVTHDSKPTQFLSVIVYRLAFNGLQDQINRLSVIVFAVIVHRISFIGYRLAVVEKGFGRVNMYVLGIGFGSMRPNVNTAH